MTEISLDLEDLEVGHYAPIGARCVLDYEEWPCARIKLTREVRALRAENAKLREYDERAEKCLDIVERSLNAVSAKRAEAERERDALKGQRKAVLDLCEDAVQYGWHDHVGDFATDSICTDRCRNRSAWDLDPAAVRAAYGITHSPEGDEQ